MRDGKSEIDVRIGRNVLISAEMSDIAQETTLRGTEDVARIASKNLPRRFEKDPGISDQLGHRQARVVDSVLASHKISRYERPVGPWEHMVVHLINSAKRSSHLAGSDK